MGTWNYAKSEIVSIGYDSDLDEADNEMETSLNEHLSYNQTQGIIKEHKFYYYEVTVKCGYYSGFYVNIEKVDEPTNSAEYNEHKAELNELKALLIRLVKECGLRTYEPSWCTSWEHNETETQNEIEKAFKGIVFK